MVPNKLAIVCINYYYLESLKKQRPKNFLDLTVKTGSLYKVPNYDGFDKFLNRLVNCDIKDVFLTQQFRVHTLLFSLLSFASLLHSSESNFLSRNYHVCRFFSSFTVYAMLGRIVLMNKNAKLLYYDILSKLGMPPNIKGPINFSGCSYKTLEDTPGVTKSREERNLDQMLICGLSSCKKLYQYLYELISINGKKMYQPIELPVGKKTGLDKYIESLDVALSKLRCNIHSDGETTLLSFKSKQDLCETLNSELNKLFGGREEFAGPEYMSQSEFKLRNNWEENLTSGKMIIKKKLNSIADYYIVMQTIPILEYLEVISSDDATRILMLLNFRYLFLTLKQDAIAIINNKGNSFNKEASYTLHSLMLSFNSCMYASDIDYRGIFNFSTEFFNMKILDLSNLSQRGYSTLLKRKEGKEFFVATKGKDEKPKIINWVSEKKNNSNFVNPTETLKINYVFFLESLLNRFLNEFKMDQSEFDKSNDDETILADKYLMEDSKSGICFDNLITSFIHKISCLDYKKSEDEKKAVLRDLKIEIKDLYRNLLLPMFWKKEDYLEYYECFPNNDNKEYLKIEDMVNRMFKYIKNQSDKYQSEENSLFRVLKEIEKSKILYIPPHIKEIFDSVKDICN